MHVMSRNIYICTVRNLKCVVTLATGVILLPSLTFTELYSIDFITPTCTWFLLQHLQTKLLSLLWNALQLAPTWPHLLRHSAKKDNKRVNSGSTFNNRPKFQACDTFVIRQTHHTPTHNSISFSFAALAIHCHPLYDLVEVCQYLCSKKFIYFS